MRRSLPVFISGLLLTFESALAGQSDVRFEPVQIDPSAGKVCYAVTIADVDSDSDSDIVVLTENRVIWYEQPTWTPHVILQDQTPPDNVCIAPHDIDRDGLVDFAIGAGWTGSGTLHWIHRGADPNALWTVAAIGEETSVHRMRWADVLGKGSPQLVVSPLNASQGNGVRLLAWETPQNPSTERWTSTVLDASLNRVHNHWHPDLNGDGSVETLAASREGLSLVERTGDEWKTTRITSGKTGQPDPNLNGAGEVKTGQLKGKHIFLTSVEPMHGDQLAVYTRNSADNSEWKRHVIHEGFRRGHALWTADFDQDGDDDIAFGHSDTPGAFGVEVWWCASDDGSVWHQQILDSGTTAVEDIAVADLNGDGRLDIVACGRSTHNVRLFLNQPGDTAK